jgi:hypothetical protein
VKVRKEYHGVLLIPFLYSSARLHGARQEASLYQHLRNQGPTPDLSYKPDRENRLVPKNES